MTSRSKDIEPDGAARAKGVEPDELAGRRASEEDDVEGHSLYMTPTMQRDLAKAREADVQRSLRQQQHEHDAKRVFRK